MQRLVGWFWGQGKKGVCVSKKVHCGPVTIVETNWHVKFSNYKPLNCHSYMIFNEANVKLGVLINSHLMFSPFPHLLHRELLRSLILRL